MKTKNYFQYIYSILLILGLWTMNANAQVSTYSFAQSTTTYTPITAGGGATTVVSAASSNWDDGGFAALSIGFNFFFNGTTYSTFSIDINGSVRMGSAISTSYYCPTNYISSGLNTNSIFGYATDLYGLTTTGSSVLYQTIGSSPNRTLVVQWTNVSHYSGNASDQWTFQVRLNETSNTVQIVWGPTLDVTINGANNCSDIAGESGACGLVGASAADANIRVVTNGLTTWATSTSASTVTTTNVCNMSSTNIPTSGLTWTWSPPPPCPAPAAQPTGLVLTPISPSQINGSFTAASPAPSAYLVVRYLTGSAVTAPVNGTSYIAGNALGLGTVVQSGIATSFSATGLLENTSYDFYIYSINTACVGSLPGYQTVSPLTATAATPQCLTPAAQPSGLSLTTISISQINGLFTAASPVADGYLVAGYISGTPEFTPVDGVTYAAGGQIGFGKVVQSSAATSFSATGLIAGTSYDVYVYAYNICPSGRKYRLAGRLLATASTLAPATFTATAQGGLWSNAQTWAGGVIPVAGSDVTIPAGSIVTVDLAVTMRNLDISGLLQWNTVANAMTLQGNLTINSGGVFLPYTSAATPLGITVNIFGNFINNGYANCALGTGTQTLIAFNGIGSTLGGTGTFQPGIDGRGIIRQLFFQSLGSSTINTAQDLTTLNLAHGGGSLNTNGKLKIDNVFQLYGMPLNTQVASVAVTTMGTYSVAPVVFGVAVTQYANALSATATLRYVSGTHVYLCTVSGIFNATAPTSTATTPFSTSGPTLLYIGETGTLGNPFQVSGNVVGTQYFYGNNLYTCIVAGTSDPNFPPTCTSSTCTSGTTVYRYAGSPATVSVNYNSLATLNVRSLNLTSGGSGYSSSTAPTLVFSVGVAGGTVTAVASATPVILYSIFGPGNSQIQRSGAATISGGLIINSDQGASASGNIQSSSGVGNISTIGGGTNYTVAPQVGFAGPLALNLITNPGSGYTTTPIITVTGGTSITGGVYTSSSFTITVNQGMVESVYLNSTTAIYSVPPTLTMSAPGGAGTTATLAFPAGCWPAATANIGTNGQILSFTMTNNGFGYTNVPLVTLGTISPFSGTFTTAATAPTARVALYNVILNFFAPATSAIPAPDDAMIPANRKINNLSLSGNGNGFNLSSNLTIFANSGFFTPLIFTASLSSPGNILNLNGNNLLFTWNGYAGTTSTFNSAGANVYIKNGSMTLTGRGGAGTFTYPFAGTTTLGGFTWFVGNTPTAVTTGCNATKYTVTETGAPSNGILGNGSAIGTRAYRAQFNAGAVSGTLPTVTMNFNSLDGLVTTQDLLFIGDATALSGGWTVRSTSFGASGALPATGSKITATVSPGPITIGADNYYAWLQALPCSGSPAAPTVTGPATACSAANITLTASGISTNLGINRQWQSATSCAGPWTDISGAANPTLTTTQTATTSYRILLTCSFSGLSTPSNCITVTGASGVTLPVITSVTANPAPVCFNASSTLTVNVASSASSYCVPAYANYDGTDAITNVTLNGSPTINNTTTNPGLPCYSNFTSTISSTLTAGGTFNISVTDGSFTNEHISAFIDYNQDGVFDLVTERILPEVVTTIGFQVMTATFTVPATALNGNTRLRVMDMYALTINTCATGSTYGETEDYAIVITGGVNSSFLTYAWSTSGPGGLSSASTNPTTGTNITGSTIYNVSVANGACAATGSVTVAPGGPLSGTINATPPSSATAYCTPAYVNYDGTDAITNVTLNGSPAINNTTNNPGLPCYSNFLNISSTLTAGSAFTISITDGTFTNESISAFIDYNQDGVFDLTTERILPEVITTISNQVMTAIFTVPINAVNGATRLRVMDMYALPINTCATGATYGETEDYTIIITGGVTASTLVCPGLPWTLSVVTTGGGAPYTYLWSGVPAATAGLVTNNTATVTAMPLAPTTYTVVITDNCGVTATQTVFANVRMTNPTIGTVTASSTTGCGVTPASPNISGAPVTFSLDAFTGDNLIWQFNVNGGVWTTIPGATTPTVSLIPTIPQGGGPVTFGLRAQSYYCAVNPATSNAITFIMDDPAAPTAATGGVRCGPGNVPVTASVPAGQTAEWYSAATGGTFLGSGSPFNYPATVSTTIYAADRNPSTGCLGSIRSAAGVTVNIIPTVAPSSNSPVCTPSSIQLHSNSSNVPAGTGAITYSQSFVNNVTPATQATAWCDFRSQLLSTNTYTSLTISGSMNPVGVTLTDPVAILAIANAMRTATNFSTVVGSNTWYVTTGCLASTSPCVGSPGVVLSVNTTSCNCDIVDPTFYVVRPEINNPNWGGLAGTSQCPPPSQTMTVVFNYATGTAVSYAWSGPNAFSNLNADPVISPSILANEGTYNVTITDNNTGCSSSGSTSVVVNAAPQITTLQSTTLNGGVATAFPAPPTFLDIPVFTTTTTCDKVVPYNVNITGKPNPAEAVGGITYSFSGATLGSGNGTGTGSTFGRLIPTGRTTVTVNANNVCGNQSKTFRVTVTDNVPPVITPIQVAASNTNGGECASTVQVTQPTLGNGLFDNCPNASLIFVSRSDGRTQFEPYYAGTTTITWQATDASANVTTATQNVVVNNLKPVITSLTSSSNVIFVGQTATFTAAFTDEDGGGTHTVKFYRDKNDASPASVKTLAPACTQSCNGTRSYTVTSDPILYSTSEVAEPKVEILDGCNLAADQVPGVTTFQYLAIAVAGNQFTTAGGHFIMQPGGFPSAYVGLDVNIGNVVKLGSGNNNNVYKGQLEMNVHLANNTNWRVHTDNGSNQDITWDYLTVSGCSLATFKGAVLLNGVSGYKVLVQQSDKDRNPSTSNFIRIKVTTNSGTVIFDTQPGLTEALTSGNGGAAAIITHLAGGSIKVQPANGCVSRIEDDAADGLLQNIPNPFTGQTEIRFSVPEDGNYTLTVYNYLGQEVTTLFNAEATTGSVYSVMFDGSNLGAGIYTYTLRSANTNETRRMNLVK